MIIRISANKICKTFKIGYKNNSGFLYWLLYFFSGKETQRPLKVLEDISLIVYEGEIVGIIGKNGSGKSTLLKIIAGIYQADSGDVKTNGELVYVNGHGFGVRDKLTMRDNIFLVGALMGLNNKEIKDRFSDIVKFSELEDFLDTKIYQFSSGMLSRLSFSITIHCLEQKNPDILLLDEVFGSGGDMSFQNKAIQKMEEFTKNGATVIMVSHDLSMIRKYCDRVILIHQNKKIIEDIPELVINKYKELSNL